MPQPAVNIRAMHRRVAACAPAGAAAHKGRVRNVPNKNLPPGHNHLRMAFQAKVVVPLHEHLVRNRPVRLMTNHAAFTQGFMLVKPGPRLFPMAFGASLIHPRETSGRPCPKRGAMRCLENVRPVRIVALHAIHPPFKHRMVLRQFELRVNIEVAIEAGLRFTPGIDDEFPPPARLRVQARRPMTGLAPSRLAVGRSLDAQPRMRTGRKSARELDVTLDATFIANKSCSFNLRRINHTPRNAGTGSQNQPDKARAARYDDRQGTTNLHAQWEGALS